jgi:DNA-binding IclR family transcriptional regulator
MMTSFKKLTSILELFLSEKEELSLSEMSDLTGLNKSTVNRIASFLVKENYLNQQGKRGKYSLGTKLFDFSAAIKSRIKVRDIAMRYMDKLMHLVKESCALTMWDGREATLVDSVEYESVLRASPNTKSKLPLHVTASGKLFLANMDEKAIEEYISTVKLENHVNHTMIDPDDLRKQLQLIRLQGFSINIEEFVVGVSSVAVSIKDSEGKIIGAIAVIGPTARLAYQRLLAIVPDIKKCALEVSRWLGWRGE